MSENLTFSKRDHGFYSRTPAGKLSSRGLRSSLAIVFTIAACAAPFYLKASAQESGAFVKAFEQRYRAARTLQATFLERYVENGVTVRTEAGTAYFRRPGRMRWEYEAPERDLFLVDGKTAWFYVPGDRTVTRVPAKQSADWRTPLALLAGEMKVSRVCSKTEIAPNEKPLDERDVVLRCHVRGSAPDREPGSKPEAQGAYDSNSAENSADGSTPVSPSGSQNDVVFFEIRRDTGELARLIARQSGGVEVEFRFENWHLDPPLPDSMFKFEVPPGVAIVNGELPQRDDGIK